MAGVEFIPLAIELAVKIEDMISWLVNGIKTSVQYGHRAETQRLRLELESATFQSIKRILFGSSGAHRGAAMFSELSSNTQIDVLNVLRLFSETLTSRLIITNEILQMSRPRLEQVIDFSIPFGSYHNASVIAKLRFGFRVNTKLEKATKELNRWNEALRSIVQLHCIERSRSTSPNSDDGRTFLSPSLKAYEEDLESLQLSCDLAVAHLAAKDLAKPDISFPNLQKDSWDYHSEAALPSTPNTRKRYIARKGDQDFLIETRSFSKTVNDEPNASSVYRIQQLCSILHEASSSRHRTLHCDEFYIDKDWFNLVFRVPTDVRPVFKPLLTCLSEKQKTKPCLDDRYILAREIAVGLLNFHAVGWVHKSVRSDNILFFASSDEEGLFEVTKPYWSGWEYARPETGLSSQVHLQVDLNENIYRHPEQWGKPTAKFNKMHDLYALGIVLFEIGNWRNARSMLPESYEDWLPQQFKNFFIHNASHPRFRGNVSKRYQRVVIRCLLGHIIDNEDSTSASDMTLTADGFSKSMSSSITHVDAKVTADNESASFSFEQLSRLIKSDLDDIVNSL